MPRRMMGTPPPSPSPSPPPLGMRLAEFGAIWSVAQLEERGGLETTWAWGHAFGERALVEICGPSGGGKTTWTVGLACARAAGLSTFFGLPLLPESPDKRIALVAEENDLPSLIGQIKDWSECLGVDWCHLVEHRLLLLSRVGTAIHRTPTRLPAEPETTWDALLSDAAAGLIGMVVIDTRAAVSRGLGESRSEDAAATFSAEVRKLQGYTEAPVLIISHTRKNAKGDDIEEVSGSGQRAAAIDTLLFVMPKTEGGRVVRSTLRCAKRREGGARIPFPEPLDFALVAQGDAMRLEFGAQGNVQGGQAPVHERVLAELEGGDLTKTELRERLKCSAATVETALTRLFSDRAVGKRAGKGKNGRHVDILFKRRDAGATSPGLSFEDVIGADE